MSTRLSLIWAILSLVSCASPLTGLQCADGFTQCGDECVDLDSDLMHCGACDMACPASGWVCIGGRCGQNLPEGGVDFDASFPPDGEVPDGGPEAGPDSGTDSGGPRPVPVPGKPLCDGTLPADECRCGVGDLKCDNLCVSPGSDPSNCGGCGVECAGDQFCAGGNCVDDCEVPFVRCGAACIDVTADFRNCGSCGNVCPTHICSDGECAGAASGHVVLIGHDYRNTNPQQSKIPPGAVSLNNKFQPSILGFFDFTDESVRERINLTLFDSLGILPEDIEQAVLPALSLQLASHDVLIVYPQTGVSQADLVTKVMTAFEGVLPAFLSAGGVVLLFEGGGTRNDGTYQIATVDGLVSVTGQRRLPVGPVLKAPAGFRGFTSGVMSPYLGENNTHGFEGIPVDDRNVLLFHEASDLPVVIHNVFVP